RPPPPSPLFPYTTLFRSKSANLAIDVPETGFRLTAELTLAPKGLPVLIAAGAQQPGDLTQPAAARIGLARDAAGLNLTTHVYHRSEEHTSELQSLAYLVC